jgi:probable F420-dependent oxidoreductase
LRFGFILFPYARFGDIGEIAETVSAAESAGFSTCDLPHHLLPPAWSTAALATKVWYDPVTLSAFLAARTSTLVFRTGVLVVPYLQPVPLAKAVATLDIISSGRFRLGVGTGWMRAEFRRLGVPFDERGAITDESLRAMRELWGADLPSFSGKHVAFQDVSFLPRPISARIPVDVGGTGPRVFRRVAELGDGWCPLALTHDAIAHGVSEIKRLLSARGRDPGELVVSVRLAVDTDPEVAAMADHVDAKGGRGAIPCANEPEPRGLIASECIEEIEALRATGVTDVTVECAWSSAEELRDKLSWFSSDVMPAFARSNGAGVTS